MTVRQLADDLAIPYSTIYNNPSSFGGVKIGGRWWFFESLVEEALWSKYKVCAFLNRHGGTILLGVDNSGEIKGINPNAGLARNPILRKECCINFQTEG